MGFSLHSRSQFLLEALYATCRLEIVPPDVHSQIEVAFRTNNGHMRFFQITGSIALNFPTQVFRKPTCLRIADGLFMRTKEL
ncbi:hypothetical protein E5S67_00775 [Microcoleus sp. IPMA8]|uniref:Uncharacterized protein n=1 Tax=Microcoleus asticus IPMA8 TaxID=2563858 RepID=A0ABX2CTS7_9CYAN|nr:hypothetical protein [Microcoleus asticus IPMA8]